MSEIRKRNRQVNVRFDDEELRQLDEIVSQTNTGSRGELMRSASLNVPIHSVLDQQAAYELRRLKGEISKIGGLIKTTHMILRDHPDQNRQLAEYVQSLTALIENSKVQLSDLFGILAEPKLLAALSPLIHSPINSATIKALKEISK